jgi:hypothetical protein
LHEHSRTKTNACGLDSGCRVSDKSMLTCFVQFCRRELSSKKGVRA